MKIQRKRGSNMNVQFDDDLFGSGINIKVIGVGGGGTHTRATELGIGFTEGRGIDGLCGGGE